jgi:ribosome biogenesis protein BMS1
LHACFHCTLLAGVVAIQNPGADVKGWRVSATGVVLELDADLRVVKKLKVGG